MKMKIKIKIITLVLFVSVGACCGLRSQPLSTSGGGVINNTIIVNPTIPNQAATGTNVYYTAVFGNDANVGTSFFSPFRSLEYVSRISTNGQTIHMISGTNPLPITTGPLSTLSPFSAQFCPPNGVNIDCDQGATLVMNNPVPNNPGNTQNAMLWPMGNNVINNLTFYNIDTNTSQCPIGFGTADNNTLTAFFGHTNIVFNNLTYYGYGNGIDLENTQSSSGTNLWEGTFNNCHITANACCVSVRGYKLAHLIFNGCTLTLTNWTNVVVNNFKPFRVVGIETTAGDSNGTFCAVEFKGCTFNISDRDQSASNRPAFLFWGSPNSGSTTFSSSNKVSFSGCVVNWLSKTNPNSADFSTNAGVCNVDGLKHSDGTRLTFQNAGDIPNGLLDYKQSVTSMAGFCFGTNYWPPTYGMFNLPNTNGLVWVASNGTPPLTAFLVGWDGASNAVYRSHLP